MIGQKRLKKRIDTLIECGKFPKFVIFTGEEGSGKRTFVEKIIYGWRFVYHCEDVKVDTIRTMIDFAYKTNSDGRCVYIIPDAQNMSIQAKNALLKIVEEPPSNATFIMTLTSRDSVPDTIISRAQVFEMDSYSNEELDEYLSTRIESVSDRAFMLNICNNVSDIEKAVRIDLDALGKHINTLLDKAHVISIGNLFKSANSIAFKDDDGFDLRLYWKAFNYIVLKRIIDNPDENAKMGQEMITATCRCLGDIQNKTVSKSNTFDMWLLDIRQIRSEYETI